MRNSARMTGIRCPGVRNSYGQLRNSSILTGMPRMLVCWIGRTDLDACRGVATAEMGPIGQALDKREFDEVVLLCNYPAADAREFEAWVAPRTSAKLSVRAIPLKDPTDYLAIYQAV